MVYCLKTKKNYNLIQVSKLLSSHFLKGPMSFDTQLSKDNLLSALQQRNKSMFDHIKDVLSNPKQKNSLKRDAWQLAYI
jgi:hypothetical protein